MRWTEIEGLAPATGATPDFAACLRAFPVLEAAKTTPQDPRHHGEGDVWTHTQMVVEALLALPAYGTLTSVERTVLFVAALLHDVAKPATTVVDEATGVVRQPGHSRRGAVDARVLLWRAGAPFDLRESVCRLIAVHQVPFFALTSDKMDPTRLASTLSWMLDTRLLAMLAEADMRGRICEDQARVLDDIELFRELCRSECCYGQERRYADPHTRLEYARHAKGHPDYPLFAEAGSEVILMSGLPASGKDTWVDAHAKGLPVVSFDDARAELGLKHGENDGAAAHRAVDKAKALLRAQAPFVWNATNISQQLRDKTLDLLYRYNARVRIVYLEQSYEELRRRNAARDSTLNQAALERMFHRWEVPIPAEAHVVEYQVAGARG